MPINKAMQYIFEAGNHMEICRKEKKIQICNKDDIKKVPDAAGCYWIETTMPELVIFNAEMYRKKKRKTVPINSKIIKQLNDKPYIIYNGTENNIRRRLNQHLFNEGNPKTGKLGLEIDKGIHAEYDWYVYYYEVPNVVIRNALEQWWRIEIGWPPFCKR